MDLAAGRVTGVALFEDAREFMDGKADGERATDESDAVERVSGIDAVSRLRPLWERENPFPFVVAKRVWTDAGDVRQFSGTVSGFGGDKHGV